MKLSKKIYFHVGQPKAASTFLQLNVFPNLVADVAFNPELIVNLIKELEWNIYVNEFLDFDFINGKRTEIYELIALLPENRILLSRELMGIHFGDLSRSGMIADMLQYVFPQAEILIIFREQVSWIKSLYSLNLQYMYLVPFEKYLNYFDGQFKGKSLHGKDWSIDYDSLHFGEQWKIYSSRFSRVHCFPFESLKDNANEFVEKLMDAMQMSLVRDFRNEKVNKRYSESRLAALSRLSTIFAGSKVWNEKYSYLPYRRKYGVFDYFKYFSRYIYGNILLGISYLISPFYRNTQLYSKQQKVRISEMYRESNDMFWESYSNLVLNEKLDHQ